jgi:adenylylsulfate kinase
MSESAIEVQIPTERHPTRSAMYRDSHSRSVAKAISWRILGTFATSILVYAFTRQWALSLTVGGVEFVSKIGLFWLHERLWDRVPHGKTGGDG